MVREALWHCLELSMSAYSGEHGSHAAVFRESDNLATFPPNTRYELREVIAPGEWVAPNGVRPQRRLLVARGMHSALGHL